MAKVVSRSGNEVTMEVTVRLQGSLLDMEAAIREAANALGCCATEEALKRFDTDGSPIRVGALKGAEAHRARARSEAVPDALRWR